jgi:hypothetical protein
MPFVTDRVNHDIRRLGARFEIERNEFALLFLFGGGGGPQDARWRSTPLRRGLATKAILIPISLDS